MAKHYIYCIILFACCASCNTAAPETQTQRQTDTPASTLINDTFFYKIEDSIVYRLQYPRRIIFENTNMEDNWFANDTIMRVLDTAGNITDVIIMPDSSKFKHKRKVTVFVKP